jgi:hypothetical protein
MDDLREFVLSLNWDFADGFSGLLQDLHGLSNDWRSCSPTAKVEVLYWEAWDVVKT